MYLSKVNYSALSNITITWWFIVPALILSQGVRYWGAFAWFILLKGIGARNLNDERLLLHIYAKSWMARYIPGGAAWMITKVYYASKHGISKSKLSVSTTFEAVLQIGVVCMLSVLLIALDGSFVGISSIERIALICFVCICAFFLYPTVFNFFLGIAHKLIKKSSMPAEDKIDSKLLIKGVLLYLAWALMGGFILYCVSALLYPGINISNLYFIVASANIAGALGMIMIFIPSGIGVKDGILILLLSSILPIEYSIAIAVFMRLWDFLMDLIFLATTSLAHRMQRLD
jgi:uncharacterized membrane protein YbhN (UPF0104 family)